MTLSSDLQEFPEIFVHAFCCQLLQAVVTMDDTVCSHYHHPNAVGVLAELAANGWAHDHVQATVTATCISVIMTREDRLHAWRGAIDTKRQKEKERKDNKFNTAVQTKINVLNGGGVQKLNKMGFSDLSK